MIRTTSLFLFLCLFGPGLHAVDGTVWTHESTGIRLAEASLDLPAEGWWYVSPADQGRPPLGFAFLREPEDALDRVDQGRSLALRLRKEQQSRRSAMWRVHWTWRRQTDSGNSPAFPVEPVAPWMHVRENVTPRLDQEDGDPVALVLELHPPVDDGKHWILRTDGSVERVDIDHERWRAEGVAIEPRETARALPEVFRYTLYAQILDAEVRQLTLTLKNDARDETRKVDIDLKPVTANPEGFAVWAEERAWRWADLENRIGDMWLDRAEDLYGVDTRPMRAQPPGRRGNTPDMLGVLGGAAAIRETLQLQNLEAGADATDEDSVPIADIPGVTVRSHDYADLLGTSEGKTIELASLCPPDRFWLYAPDAAALVPLLDGGGDWLAALRGGMADRLDDHQILKRHLSRLGLDEAGLRRVLQSGMLGEIALMLPDLFLIEGTDITCVARVRNLPALTAIFQAGGIAPSPAPRTFTPPGGDPVTWALRDDLLVLGTHAGEVADVLALHDKNGRGSLGASAEFRYMLTQCAPSPDTRVFAYFSDAFIRRLTGPAVKIGQYRRLLARADLERFHAGALLHRQDTGRAPDSLEALAASGRIAPLARLRLEDLRFENGIASHPDWGRVGAMSTLLEREPDSATATEVKAYRAYRQRYERFWRQFFDPIALRLDVPEPGSYEATVFVLPLINSSIYEGLREVLSVRNATPPLPRPAIDPAPVAMLSLNPNEDAWLDMIQGISETFTETSGIDFPLWEHLGPGLHLGIADSDSVLTFGSGGLTGLFSGSNRFRGGEMVWVPMMVSLFTRPAVVAVELRDPELALEKLRRMHTVSARELQPGWGIGMDLTRVTGRDRWLVRISIADVMYVSMSMEIQDGYLVLSNQPMTYQPKVRGRERPALHHAAARFDPAAADQTRRGFATAALDQARRATHNGLGVFEALAMSGIHTLDHAIEHTRARFGFAPAHPAPGQYVDTPSGVRSDLFGERYEARQPPLEDIDEPFGTFPSLKELDVTLQLEGEGLRARIGWDIRSE